MGEIYTKLDDGIILIKLDKSVYEKEAVMAAAYKLTNSCLIIVKPLENNQLGVYFEPKNNHSDLEKLKVDISNLSLDKKVTKLDSAVTSRALDDKWGF